MVKTTRKKSNYKPWLTGEVRSLLRVRGKAFKSGDAAAYSLARKNLSQGIREVRKLYTQKQYTRIISLNQRNFYAQFEVSNTDAPAVIQRHSIAAADC